MHRTNKELTADMAISEIEKVISLVCSLSNKEVPDKTRFHSHCEEIGYEVRNQLYRDGLIGTGDGVVRIKL